uniref:Secreted protein n=1 Tax=Rhipicephalus appendiculatus TaxID=34631 RepID=A0A131YBP1_RHIAP
MCVFLVLMASIKHVSLFKIMIITASQACTLHSKPITASQACTVYSRLINTCSLICHICCQKLFRLKCFDFATFTGKHTLKATCITLGTGSF